MGRLLALVALVAAGCFYVDAPDAGLVFTCRESPPECPANFTCLAGTCQENGDGLDAAMSDAAGDAGTGSTDAGAAGDAAGAGGGDAGDAGP